MIDRRPSGLYLIWPPVFCFFFFSFFLSFFLFVFGFGLVGEGRKVKERRIYAFAVVMYVDVYLEEVERNGTGLLGI